MGCWDSLVTVWFALRVCRLAILPIGAGIIACLGVAYLLNKYDEKFGVTESVIQLIEGYEEQFKANVNEKLAEGVYYIVDSSRRYVVMRVHRVFIERLKSLRPRLNPQWL